MIPFYSKQNNIYDVNPITIVILLTKSNKFTRLRLYNSHRGLYSRTHATAIVTDNNTLNEPILENKIPNLNSQNYKILQI